MQLVYLLLPKYCKNIFQNSKKKILYIIIYYY